MPEMNRRTFLATTGLAVAGFAVGCKKKPSALPSGVPLEDIVNAAKARGEEITVVQAIESILVRPRSRVSFALVDKAGTKRFSGGSVRVYWSPFDSTQAALGPVTADYHGEGLGEKGIYIARLDIDRPGNWNVMVAGKPGGASKEVWGGAAYPAVERVHGPGPGSKALPVPTPTVDNHRGVEPYCTSSPPCSMHTISLDVALANGRPTVFNIGTPRFCSSQVCGPVVDVIAKVSSEFTERVNFVHAEVYRNDTDAPAKLTNGFSPTAKAWSLEEEPASFWIKSDNTIVERIIGPTDIREVRELTQALLT